MFAVFFISNLYRLSQFHKTVRSLLDHMILRFTLPIIFQLDFDQSGLLKVRIYLNVAYCKQAPKFEQGGKKQTGHV